MKLSFGKRLLLLVHWLGSLAAVAWLAFPEEVGKLIDPLTAKIGETYTHYAYIAALAVYALLALAVLLFVVFGRAKKRPDRGFITVDSSETGKVRIAISAIETMVRTAVGAVDGIDEMKISIVSLEDAVGIHVNTNIINGTHVPTVTLNMQRAIRQFVEMNCGVTVRTVTVDVNRVVTPNEGKDRKKGKQAPAPVQEAKEVETTPVVEPVVSSEPAVEEPVEVVEPVVEETTEETVSEWDNEEPSADEER